MRRRLLQRVLAACAALVVTASTAAKDSILASAYGPVVNDLLFAFHATEEPCVGAVDMSDLCFSVTPATAGALAESLELVVAGYGSAGLQRGEWRAANGVWAVELVFGGGAYGTVEVYLTETELATVRGKVILRTR